MNTMFAGLDVDNWPDPENRGVPSQPRIAQFHWLRSKHTYHLVIKEWFCGSWQYGTSPFEISAAYIYIDVVKSPGVIQSEKISLAYSIIRDVEDVSNREDLQNKYSAGHYG